MSSPPPKSLVPAPASTVWPPSNPSGTVIPFPLPWGQTGCCPPGGMDALMKCYCDLQQASAFIGQVMLDQINNNPAIIAAIIAGIEKSGSNLPTVGVTDGSNAQPGQVGEFVYMAAPAPFGTGTSMLNLGVLQPGDWDCWAWMDNQDGTVTTIESFLNPLPAGFSNNMNAFTYSGTPAEDLTLVQPAARANITVPTLLVFQFNVTGFTPPNGFTNQYFAARRRR